MSIYLSVIVPIHNEEENINELYQQILHYCQKKLKKTFEIIFVDDGSSDQGLLKMKKLKPLKIIKLRKNFGQTAALDAGIKEAQGQYIATLDGDLQNDPNDIEKILQYLKEKKLDLVIGWRQNRQDSFGKRFLSRGAHLLRNIFIKDNIHDSGCTLKVFRKECFDSIDLMGEMHRFIPAILKWRGFKIGEIKVTHRARLKGQTKYGLERIIRAFLDMITLWFWKKFAGRPLHLFGGIGIIFIIIGGLSFLYAIYLKLKFNHDLSETALTMLSIFSTLTGIQLFASGLLADIMGKTHFASSKKEKPYYIKKIIENK